MASASGAVQSRPTEVLAPAMGFENVQSFCMATARIAAALGRWRGTDS